MIYWTSRAFPPITKRQSVNTRNCSCNDSSLWGEFIIVCRLFWCYKEVSKVHSTYFVMDVVVHSRNSIILICSRVKQAKALHAHGVNCVGDRLIEILRQKVRSIQLRARRLNSCSLLQTNYQPITILPAISKVFEKIVHCRISPYFEEIYHKYVFAYRCSDSQTLETSFK